MSMCLYCPHKNCALVLLPNCFLFFHSSPQVVMTRQETPNTDKPLREDLHEKVMSGDLVAA